MTAFPRILNIIHQYALHTLPTMLDAIPEGVRQEYVHWYGAEMLDGYHLEYDTLLWIPWGGGGSLLMAHQDRYELYSFQMEGGNWKYVGPRETETVSAIIHLYGATNEIKK